MIIRQRAAVKQHRGDGDGSTSGENLSGRCSARPVRADTVNPWRPDAEQNLGFRSMFGASARLEENRPGPRAGFDIESLGRRLDLTLFVGGQRQPHAFTVAVFWRLGWSSSFHVEKIDPSQFGFHSVSDQGVSPNKFPAADEYGKARFSSPGSFETEAMQSTTRAASEGLPESMTRCHGTHQEPRRCRDPGNPRRPPREGCACVHGLGSKTHHFLCQQNTICPHCTCGNPH
jgi:hypothetical protein